MGEKLVKYYDLAADRGGMMARMRLAVMTSISSAKAPTAPDSTENIEAFRKAIKEITGEDAPTL